MQADDGAYLIQDAKLDHKFGAAQRAGRQTFFRGLENKADTAGQGLPEFGKQFGGPQGDGQVKIVAAGVHDSGILGGPGFVRRFLDGQGIHVGPPGKGRAGPGADEVRDHAVAGDAGLDGQAQAGQILGGTRPVRSSWLESSGCR